MNAHARKLLMNLLILIVHVLCARPEITQADRTQLATLTAQLQAAMDESKQSTRQSK